MPRCLYTGPAYSDMGPLAKALIAANAQRILWVPTGPTPTRRWCPAELPWTSLLIATSTTVCC